MKELVCVPMQSEWDRSEVKFQMFYFQKMLLQKVLGVCFRLFGVGWYIFVVTRFQKSHIVGHRVRVRSRDRTAK